MMKSGNNYRKLVTRVVGEDWEGDVFDRLVIHYHPEELDEYVDHLHCCDYREVKVCDTREREVVIIDTPYDEEVNRTRKRLYEFFMDRLCHIHGKYLCDYLGIAQDVVKEHLEYLLKEVQ